ncbi:MAG: hypothetical protein AB7Q00_14820 [Phycisphaerales bacterium]
MAVRAQAPSFDLITPTPGWERTSVTGLSYDGKAVGWSHGASAFSVGPIFTYSSDGTRLEYSNGTYPIISGDGRVVAITNSSTPTIPPRLYYDNGTYRNLPNVSLAGQVRQGRVTHLNTDGSVAMLNTSFVDSIGRSTAYRWTESGGAQIPPFPGGSTWNHANGMSSDGSIVVGDWASNSTNQSSPMLWEDAGPSLSSVTLADGTPIDLGILTTVTGDGRTMFLRSDQAPAGRYMIHDGVANPYMFDSPLGGALSLPTGASYDGSVLVGSLGQFGSWIWTQETGAMRAEDFLRSHGLAVPIGAFFDTIFVSGDGQHFGGLVSLPNNGGGGYLATIPAPCVMSSLLLLGFTATSRRHHR